MRQNRDAVHRQAIAEAQKWVDAQDTYRKERLAALEKDKAFVIETDRIVHELQSLRNRKPDIFQKVFRRLSPLVILEGKYWEGWLRDLADVRARTTFRNYVRYVVRFKVRLASSPGTFRPVPFGPAPVHTLHARIVKGRLHWADWGPQPKESVYDFLFIARDFEAVPELREMMHRGDARFVKVDTPRNESVLKELEYLAYDPSMLTFIIHYAEQPRIYCLIGEAVRTDKAWRDAGKVITALQKRLYGRNKAGRPANISRLKQGLRLARSSKPPKEKAFGSNPTPVTAKELENQLRYQRTVNALTRDPRTKASH
jgi:hypothetical protein